MISYSTYVYRYFAFEMLREICVHVVVKDLSANVEYRLFKIICWYDELGKCIGYEFHDRNQYDLEEKLGHWDTWMEKMNTPHLNQFTNEYVEKIA